MALTRTVSWSGFAGHPIQISLHGAAVCEIHQSPVIFPFALVDDMQTSASVMCIGAALLALESSTQASAAHSMRGDWAALGAGAFGGQWMYLYRKAYLSGMNPLSFVMFLPSANSA